VNDIDDVLLQARDALSGARMETPVEAILAKGRSGGTAGGWCSCRRPSPPAGHWPWA
jgi:hypothetical protein